MTFIEKHSQFLWCTCICTISICMSFPFVFECKLVDYQDSAISQSESTSLEHKASQCQSPTDWRTHNSQLESEKQETHQNSPFQMGHNFSSILKMSRRRSLFLKWNYWPVCFWSSFFEITGLMPNNGCILNPQWGRVGEFKRPEMSLLHFVLVQMLEAKRQNFGEQDNVILHIFTFNTVVALLGAILDILHR